MRVLRLRISDPIATALVSNPELGSLWEYLRRAGRRVTSVEVADATGLPIDHVSTRLGQLVDLGLAMPPSRRGHQDARGHATAVDAIEIAVDPTADDRPMHDLMRALRACADDALGPEPSVEGAASPADWSAYFISLEHLDERSVAEVRSRLKAVVEFVELLGQAKPKHATPTPALANYAIMFRVERLRRPMLPTPNIRFVNSLDRSRQARSAQDDGSTQRGLSRREYEVALGLARGMTVREVASQLGVTHGTAATLCRRAYRKLGVTRRADLVSKLRAAYSQSADPA